MKGKGSSVTERESIEELKRITEKIGWAGTELEGLVQDEMPKWLRLEVQDDLERVDWLIVRAYDILSLTEGRAEMLLLMEREGFEDIDRAVETELEED